MDFIHLVHPLADKALLTVEGDVIVGFDHGNARLAVDGADDWRLLHPDSLIQIDFLSDLGDGAGEAKLLQLDWEFTVLLLE